MNKIPANMKLYDFAPITSEDRIEHIPLGGKPIECLMYDDALMTLDTRFILPDIRQQVPNIRNMEMDKDDVIICAFPKAGTHWLWEIVSMLRRGKAEYHGQTKGMAMMEFVPPDKLREHPKPRVYNTHFTYSHIPRQAIEKKCKIIFIERNPKDILVSFLPFLKGMSTIKETVEWNEFIERYMELDINVAAFNWFYYTKSWHKILKEKHDNIHCVTFEDLKEDLKKLHSTFCSDDPSDRPIKMQLLDSGNIVLMIKPEDSVEVIRTESRMGFLQILHADPVREISKLAKFLEVEENKPLFEEIADKCSFSNLKKAAQSKRHLNESVQSSQFVYRKGEVGNWKNYFTVSQNERFDALYNEKMKYIDVKYRFSL